MTQTFKLKVEYKLHFFSVYLHPAHNKTFISYYFEKEGDIGVVMARHTILPIQTRYQQYAFYGKTFLEALLSER